MGDVITVDGVRKTYGNLTAVDGVDFAVESGEFFGILGSNGAGKTTILEIVEGLRAADSGSVSLLGASPWPRNAALLPRIGVQLQASAFFERLTAREQIQTFASLYGVRAAAVMSGSAGWGSMRRPTPAPRSCPVVNASDSRSPALSSMNRSWSSWTSPRAL